MGQLTPEQANHLPGLFMDLGVSESSMELLENLYNDGVQHAGQPLAWLYIQLYSPERPQDVPESRRERLMLLLLDYADRKMAAQLVTQKPRCWGGK